MKLFLFCRIYGHNAVIFYQPVYPFCLLLQFYLCLLSCPVNKQKYFNKTDFFITVFSIGVFFFRFLFEYSLLDPEALLVRRSHESQNIYVHNTIRSRRKTKQY